MRTRTIGIRLAAAAVALFLAGCIEPTDPIVLVEARVAHAAPGAGSYAVSVDLIDLIQLSPLEYVYFPVQAGPHVYRFAAEADTITVTAAHQADITALILLDSDAPVVSEFRLDRVTTGTRIAVINGAPAGLGAMTLTAIGPDGDLTVTVAAGASEVIEPGTGTIDLTVRFGETDEPVELAAITLGSGDNGFLVVAPDPTTEAGVRSLIF